MHTDPYRLSFLARLREVALTYRRPIMFGVLATKQGDDPTPWGYQTKYIDDTVAAGGRMFGQGTTKSINAIFSLKSYLPFDVLQVDDGWQVAAGDWEANAKFPQGMQTLAQQIKATGRRAGIWLAPLVATVDGVGGVLAAVVAGAMADRLGGLENVERALKRAAAAEVTHLEARVPFLGTTASAAPFVGLFGTVWGIMRAFHDIYQMGNANLATVAKPISEALIATAVGLFAAIPAVVFYNLFVSRIRVLDSEMTNFSNDFLNIVKRHFFS